jgi:hypothetical protein
MGANGGKGKEAKGKTLDWANLNLIFLFFLFLTLLSKIISLHPNFNYENRAKIRSKK